MFILLTLLLQGGKPPPPLKVDPIKVNDAIKRGADWLSKQGNEITAPFNQGQRHQGLSKHTCAELVLLTLLHAGFYTEEHPKIVELAAFVVKKELLCVYDASVQAMALQKLNPKKYHARLVQIAQFLCDQQADNGQWDYGGVFKQPAGVKPPPLAPAVGIKGVAKRGADPVAVRASVRKLKRGPPSGDNSNTQFAALGLRACIEADIEIEGAVITKARDWWISNINKDYGWGYGDRGESSASCGSMTAGGISSLCIYRHYLGEDFKEDETIQRGIQWMRDHYDITANPCGDSRAVAYYLYGLERAGDLFGFNTLAAHDWYTEGALVLINTQKGEGDWEMRWGFPPERLTNTCFAVLFLRRATPPLIITEPSKLPKEK